MAIYAILDVLVGPKRYLLRSCRGPMEENSVLVSGQPHTVTVGKVNFLEMENNLVVNFCR